MTAALALLVVASVLGLVTCLVLSRGRFTTYPWLEDCAVFCVIAYGVASLLLALAVLVTR